MQNAQSATDLYEIRGPAHHFRPGLPTAPSVSRPGLVRRIEDGMTGRLVLITAPAGWGKTNVLAEWVRTTSMVAAWVNCERIGNDAARFVRSIMSSVTQVCPDFGGDLFAMLRSSRPLPTGQLLAALADAIVEHGDPLALVLDDFHVIDDPGLVEGIHRLVSSGPENLRLVIAGRKAPRWPVARWRVDGDIVEIGIRDLAFTRDEAVSLLDDVDATGEIVDALLARSEGWAAGLRLGRLWWRHHRTRDGAGPLLPGTNRDVADYLAEEVLSRLPAETERFLMATSVVDRFCASLAGELASVQDPESIIESIERQELFISPLDQDRQWYRYHDLFREFLRARLERFEPEAETDLQRRAGDWFDRHGMLVDGAIAFVKAGEPEKAAALVERVAGRLLLREGETLTLIRMVEQLPKEVVQRFPELQMYLAWALVFVGRLEEAERIARELESGDPNREHDADRERRAGIASIRSRIAAYRGDHDATIAHANEALEYASPDWDRLRADCLLSLGFAYRAIGRLDDACDAFGQATLLGWSTGFVHAALWGSRYQALTFMSRGDLRDADTLIEANMERSEEAGMSHGPTQAALLVSRGELRYERNDLAGAERDLTQGLRMAREVADAKILMNALVAVSKLQVAQGDVLQGRDTARRATKVFDGAAEKALEAWLALRHDDLSSVRRWMEWYVDLAGGNPDLAAGETEQVMLGRAMLALGDVDGARPFLETLLQQAMSEGRFGAALSIRILLAQAADQVGEAEEANAHAREVIDVAMRERYVRSILDEGPAFLRILRRAMRQDESRERRRYAAHLLGTGEGTVDSGLSSDSGTLTEPLTPRQQEVLRLMVDGLSNREIAEALYVAEGTVKAHVNQIFGKLMVRNRSEAVRVAQTLGSAGAPQ